MLETKKKPACFFNRCSIQDIQAEPNSRRLHTIVEGFMLAEALSDSPGYSKIQERAIEESGLDTVPVTAILRLKRIFAEYRNRKK